MDLGSAPRSLVSKPRFAQRLAALKGEDWLETRRRSRRGDTPVIAAIDLS